MDARTKLTDAWPLFGLRLRTEHLVLRMPTDDDVVELLQVAKAGIHPPDEMPFGVAWTSVEGPAFDRSFMQHYWRARGAFSPEAWFLNFMVELDGRPIGAQHVEAEEFAILRTVHTGSWLGPRAPGSRPRQGDARGGARVRLRRARRARRGDLGLPRQRRPRTACLARSATRRTGSAAWLPRASPRVTQKFRMTAESWRSRPRPPLAIEGLDGIRDMFGAASADRA